MSLSMYQASVPAFTDALSRLRHILEKGIAYVEEKKIKPEVMPHSRLYPDMLPLINQIQIATDAVKFGAARLAGKDAPKYEDNETTMQELVARVDKTLSYLKTFTAKDIDGSEGKSITVPRRSGDLTLSGQDYLIRHVLPNMYFHVTTAYNILRHNGVVIGKRDYLST